MSITRRDLFSIAAGGAAAAVLGQAGCRAVADARATGVPAGPPLSRFRPGQHAVVPLPFTPSKLRDFSEKIVVSHHGKNYAGAVKKLNAVEREIAALPANAPGYRVGALKQRELVFTNSMILHEHYFANLGGDGKPAGTIAQAIAASFGTLGAWEAHFRATGMSLGGGSGWVILDYNFHTGGLRTYWSGDHSHSVAFGQPLLVMDMYEHSYQMDWGANAARYIDAFFANIDWARVDGRLQRARKAHAALRA